MKPVTVHEHAVEERVLEQIDGLIARLQRLGKQISEEDLRRSRERLIRLRDAITAGGDPVEALSEALNGLDTEVNELTRRRGDPP